MPRRCRSRALAALVVWSLASLPGCDSLFDRPGGDFRVTVRSALPLVVSQRVAPVELVFAVEGCGDFRASFGATTTSGVVTANIDAFRRDDGLYRALLPVELVTDGDRCNSVADAPAVGSRRLTIECQDQRRTAEANLPIAYAATAASFRSVRGPTDHVLPGKKAGSFFAVGGGWLSYYEAGVTDPRGEAVTTVAPDIVPRLVVRDRKAYLWAGCPVADCLVTVPDERDSGVVVRTNSSYLVPFDFDPTSGALDSALEPIPVPVGVVDMVVAARGAIVLVSTTTSTVTLTTVGTLAVTSREVFADERNPTDFARRGDALVFLDMTVGDAAVRMRDAEGALVGEYPLDGNGAVTFLSLAPSGTEWLYVRGGEARLAGFAPDGTLLPARLLVSGLPIDDASSTAWLDHQVGLWNRRIDGTAELHARIAEPVTVVPVSLTTSGRRSQRIARAFGLGERLALATTDGVEIFDAAGHSVGGAASFNGSCGRPFFEGSEATVLGGDTLALGGLSNISLFRP